MAAERVLLQLVMDHASASPTTSMVAMALRQVANARRECTCVQRRGAMKSTLMRHAQTSDDKRHPKPVPLAVVSLDSR